MAHKNRIAELCLAAAFTIFLILSTCVIAFAAVPNLDRMCTATFTIENDGKPVSGGDLVMYRIAQWEFRDNSYGFVWVPELEDSGLELKDKYTELFARRVSMLVDSRSLLGVTQQIDANGTAKFTDLPCGLYVVYQTRPAPGYERLSAFCVSLPYAKDGMLAYDVTGSPKPRPEKTTDPTHPTSPTDPSTPTVPPGTNPPGTNPPGTNPPGTTRPGSTPPTSPTPGGSPPSVTTPHDTPSVTTPAYEEVTTAPSTTAPSDEPERLPQTGQLWWPVFVLSICGAALLGVGVALRILYRHGLEEAEK